MQTKKYFYFLAQYSFRSSHQRFDLFKFFAFSYSYTSVQSDDLLTKVPVVGMHTDITRKKGRKNLNVKFASPQSVKIVILYFDMYLLMHTYPQFIRKLYKFWSQPIYRMRYNGPIRDTRKNRGLVSDFFLRLFIFVQNVSNKVKKHSVGTE